MKLAEYDQYTIEHSENMLIVDAKGNFDIKVTQQYVQDMYNACELFNNNPWGLLATFYGNRVFTPDAEIALMELTKYRIKRGMIANASVILDSNTGDIQQLQLRRIYQSHKLTFHMFSDIENARKWLDSFISDKKKR
ncbi:hypothetical protein [Thalassotalea piscium]|uniref:STAS/SEC14 domain-containing protein n=1 Tax=Thalassotalea piscium TaxID=1230533 RepID=A0A7X0NJQ1_9GAMM|nr:hypothetical protein [Thalassotalea piscium]MBB6544643.1 hypothetical protein [Thalassotalea piscium]